MFTGFVDRGSSETYAMQLDENREQKAIELVVKNILVNWNDLKDIGIRISAKLAQKIQEKMGWQDLLNTQGISHLRACAFPAYPENWDFYIVFCDLPSSALKCSFNQDDDNDALVQSKETCMYAIDFDSKTFNWNTLTVYAAESMKRRAPEISDKKKKQKV
jgi:hypothetical protein